MRLLGFESGGAGGVNRNLRPPPVPIGGVESPFFSFLSLLSITPQSPGVQCEMKTRTWFSKRQHFQIGTSVSEEGVGA